MPINRLPSNGKRTFLVLTIEATDTRFFIDLVPAMPQVSLTAKLDGKPVASNVCTWRFALEYPDFIAVPLGQARPVTPKIHPPIAPVSGNPAIVPFSTLMCGRPIATVEIMSGGPSRTETRKDILIGGSNPTASDLRPQCPSKWSAR